jgi:hypothetical protein
MNEHELYCLCSVPSKWYLVIVLAFAAYFCVVYRFVSSGTASRYARRPIFSRALLLQVIHTSSLHRDTPAYQVASFEDKRPRPRERPRVKTQLEGVVVLGMHRSGTSMATGLLGRMGLRLGEPWQLLGPQVRGWEEDGCVARAISIPPHHLKRSGMGNHVKVKVLSASYRGGRTTRASSSAWT